MTKFGSELILARLTQLHPKKIDLSLDRIQRLLAALGHPEKRLPPVIHIAGTNGKGSTLAMLDAMLTASGKRVHRYISPHLVNFNERILIHGKPIPEAALAACLDQCEQANQGEPITFFEITTAAAMLAFTQTPADYVLLETGLGGRVDAANVVDQPELTLISPISMDHEAYLGDTLAKIAFEKAGIIKKSVPALFGPQLPDAADVLIKQAALMQAPVQMAGQDWTVTPSQESGGFDVTADGDTVHFPNPALTGQHQYDNAGLAIAAARYLGLALGDIRKGLQTVRWPARLQPVTKGTLIGRLRHSGQEIWLDGGHNPAAGEAMAKSLETIAQGRPIDLVLGMLNTKDVQSYLKPLSRHIDRLVAVAVPDEPASRDPEQISKVAEELGMDASASLSIEHAVSILAASKPVPRVILICGSLYLAGHVLKTINGCAPDGFNHFG